MGKNANLTSLLQEFSNGNEGALEELLPRVYEDLKRQANRYMNRENSGHTLQPTALVHEAFLRLINQKEIDFKDRRHFFAVAAQQMRRILTDHAKAKHAQKRGGKRVKLAFDEKIHWNPEDGPDLIALDDALTQLSQMNERQGKVVELRYFGGLSVEETAEVLEISPATVKRDWVVARTWLYRKLNDEPESE